MNIKRKRLGQRFTFILSLHGVKLSTGNMSFFFIVIFNTKKKKKILVLNINFSFSLSSLAFRAKKKRQREKEKLENEKKENYSEYLQIHLSLFLSLVNTCQENVHYALDYLIGTHLRKFMFFILLYRSTSKLLSFVSNTFSYILVLVDILIFLFLVFFKSAILFCYSMMISPACLFMKCKLFNTKFLKRIVLILIFIFYKTF